MAHHRAVAGTMREFDRLQRFRQGADLVHLHQDGVGDAGGDAAPQAFGVGDEIVVAHQLQFPAQRVGQQFPAVPVVLGAAVLDRDDRVAGGEIAQVVRHAGGIQHLAFAGHMVAPVLEELGSRAVEREHHILPRPVAGALAGARDESQRLVGRFQVGREPALVAHVGAEMGVMQPLAQGVEDFRAHPHRLGDRAGADRLDHELLDVDRVVGVPPAVDDVHHRHRQGAGIDAADIAVQRLAEFGRGRLRQRERDRQDGVGAQAGFVRRAVQIDQDLVQLDLLGRVHPADRVENLAFHIGDRLLHALAAEAGGIAVAQFHRLMCAGGGAGGHRGAAHRAAFQRHIDLHGGVAPAVQDFAGDDIGDGAHGAASGAVGAARAAGSARRVAFRAARRHRAERQAGGRR